MDVLKGVVCTVESWLLRASSHEGVVSSCYSFVNMQGLSLPRPRTKSGNVVSFE